MSDRIASCACGQLQVSVAAEPIGVTVCHCLACQARTGSTYGVQATFPANAVTITGNYTVFTRTGDEGSKIAFHFCPKCGSTVYYQINVEQSLVVPVGAFADPKFPAPNVSVYEERMHEWVSLPANVQHIF